MKPLYKPITPRQIRLLKVSDPGPAWLPARLYPEFSLRVFTWDNLPPYFAISYCWGMEPATKVIVIDGRTVKLRPNIHRCLMELRDRARGGGSEVVVARGTYGGGPGDTFLTRSWSSTPSYVWIDTLCIDQANAAEKNSQVRLMDLIYERALTVAVWLGTPEPRSELEAKNEELRKAADAVKQHVTHQVDNLARHEYWTRVWVIQEFLLARRIQVWMEGGQMDWSSLKGIVMGSSGVSSSTEDAAFKLVSARHPDYMSPFRRPLWHLLLAYRDCRCSDPRDKVFGLLSLTPSDERVALGAFFPDYSMSHGEVVVKTLTHIMEWHGVSLSEEDDALFSSLELACSSLRERREFLSTAKEKVGDYHGHEIPAMASLLTSPTAMCARCARSEALPLHDKSPLMTTLESGYLLFPVLSLLITVPILYPFWANVLPVKYSWAQNYLTVRNPISLAFVSLFFIVFTFFVLVGVTLAVVGGSDVLKEACLGSHHAQ